MRRLLTVAALVLLATPALAGAARGQLELRKVDAGAYPLIEVTVVAPVAGGPAPTLRENGRRVSGLEAQNLGDQRAIVVAIDRSRSMRGQPIVEAARAAQGFVARKAQSDRIELLAFGSQAATLTGFSQATIDAEVALRSLEVDRVQGTALYDAVLLASRELRREALPGKVLVLLTDGANSGGKTSLSDALRVARADGIAVYTIAIGSQQLVTGPLRRLARATGGNFYAAPTAGALSRVYATIAQELRRTWRLSYATTARPGAALRLTVRRAGAKASSEKLAIPGKTVSQTEDVLVPAGLLENGWTPLLVALFTGLLLVGAWRAGVRRQGGEELRRRLAPHVGEQLDEVEEQRPSLNPRARLRALSVAAERRFGKTDRWRRLEGLLERAAVPLQPAELLYLGVGLGLALAFLAVVIASSKLAVAVAFAFGVGAPILVVSFKAARRVRAFDEQLPDLLAAVGASLKAGHSLKQGLTGVIDETGPPAGVEFGRVLAESRLGRPLDEALDAMCARVGSEDLEYVTSAVSVQEQVGGSLASLFDMVSDTVRERQQHARKVRSLTAMGRASAYVLTGLPFVMAGLITVINPSYMDPLYFTTTGHVLIGIGLTMICFGALCLKKIVTIRG